MRGLLPFLLLFSSDISQRLLNTTFGAPKLHGVTCFKSYDTQEASDEVSPDLAVILIDVEAGEGDQKFLSFLPLLCLHFEGLERSPTLEK